VCKLCNTNRKPKKIFHNTTQRNIEFMDTVKDYICEYPCTPCTVFFFNRRSFKAGGDPIKAMETIDDYIIQKLLSTYSKNFSAYEKKRTRIKVTCLTTGIPTFKHTLEYGKKNITRVGVCKNIRKVTNTTTGSISYTVVVRVHNKQINRTASSIEEAKKIRKELKCLRK